MRMENRRDNFSVISKLRVSGNRRDALSQRLFFERLFGAADFHPPGVPPRALVCIRKLNAPPLESRRSGVLSLDWEIGIRRAVERLARRAFRPVREIVPAEAESVLFEDKAEMLACLARDWLAGALAGNWWWRALFPSLFSAGTIAEIWLERAEFAPAALEILSKTGAAETFVGKLEPFEAVRLLDEIVRIFGLDKLSAALTEAPAKKERAVSEKFDEAPIKRVRENEKPAATTKLDVVLGLVIPESKRSDFGFERQILLETALLLARSPRVARSAEFAERVLLIREKNEPAKTVTGLRSVAAEKKAAREKRPPIRKVNKPGLRDRSVTPKSESQSGKLEPSFPAAGRAEKSDQPSEETPPVLSRKHQAPTEPSAEAKKIEAAPPPTAKIVFETFELEKTAEPTAQKTKPRESVSVKPLTTEHIFENFFETPEDEIELSFQTRFGGVFYLLNLGLYLGLYRDFTEASVEEIDLNIWDFVALVAREFLGERIEADAVWDFLKLAAEREDDRDFGREFDNAKDWRMPPVWLATFFEDRNWVWAKRRKRLVVRHPQGFNVIDVQGHGRAEKQLARELEIYRRYFADIVPADAEIEPLPEPAGWLENLAEYLRKRLFQALNVATAEELNAVLFEQRARVTVSATHLEIIFALADLPIEVRLAGIDRNPAWIPAAGKYVYFHFV